MIVMDFLTNRMPGMVDRLSIVITYQPTGTEEELSIAFEQAVDYHTQGLKPHVDLVVFPPKIILPGM